MKAELIFERAGDNLFVDGLHRRAGSLHIVPSLTRDDLAIDGRKRLFVSQFQRGGKITARVETRDGRVIRKIIFRENGVGRIALGPHDFKN